ncbi:MAG: glycine--tRNA ligase, partial [Candidatus Nitrosothermus koennekii]
MNYDTVMKFALEEGFYFPSCEIYPDAQAGFWDYGPRGVSLKNKFIELWRRELVRRDSMVEIDGSQIMSKSVFIASGHLENFNDPIVKCKNCSAIYRADRYIMEHINILIPERMDDKEMDQLILKHNIRCDKCKGELDKVSRFNMMFKVTIGPNAEEAYLRPETCQTIFVDFARIFKIMRHKLPLAVAQIGKSFRNEIAPRQSLLRLREFYQAEIEVFCNPNRLNDIDRFHTVKNTKLRIFDDKLSVYTAEEAVEKGVIPNKLIAYYLALLTEFYEKTGIDMNRSRFRRLGDDEKAFYAEVAFDFEVETSVGWLELVACNYRSDYDLSGHMRVSKENLQVMDGNEKILPHVFELSMGIDRSLYTILEHSLIEDKEHNRRVLRVKPYLAPIHAGILPLVNKDGLDKKALEIFYSMNKDFDLVYDASGSIGRRYRRLDEIGAPFAITIDRDTLNDKKVTVRDRDSMEQVRVAIDDLK